MSIRQTRVFVLSSEPELDWAETLVGKVFRPLTKEYVDNLAWFWFSRYASRAEESGDCNIELIPDGYKQPLDSTSGKFRRSMRFRFKIEDNFRSPFEQRGLELINQGGYRISDFRDYDFVRDTGSNRFLGVENRQPDRAEIRAMLTTTFYWATSKLVIDTLVGPDERGRFRAESSDDALQNPRGSTFQSLLHLFCNITSVPTDVYIWQKPSMNLIAYGTFIYGPPELPGGWESVTRYAIRY